MARSLAVLGTLVVASGGTTSGWLNSKLGFSRATDIVVFGPAAATGTFGVEVSWLDVPGVTDYGKLKIDGTQVSVGALDAAVCPSSSFKSFRVKSTLAEAADRTLIVMGQLEVS